MKTWNLKPLSASVFLVVVFLLLFLSEVIELSIIHPSGCLLTKVLFAGVVTGLYFKSTELKHLEKWALLMYFSMKLCMTIHWVSRNMTSSYWALVKLINLFGLGCTNCTRSKRWSKAASYVLYPEPWETCSQFFTQESALHLLLIPQFLRYKTSGQ